MNQLTWLQMANAAVSHAVTDCLCKSKIGGWSENHITTQVLDALEKVGTELAWSDQAQYVRWEGYKLIGAHETDFGDIALLVRVWLTSEKHIDGVAYYEAKRQYFSDTGAPIGFKSIKSAQLDRIANNTHASHLLLYDADHSTGHGHLSAVPMRFAAELAKGTLILAHSSGRVLHRYGLPWLVKLSNNFRGFELDFTPAAVAKVREMAQSIHPPYALLNVAVGMLNMLEPKLDAFCETLAKYSRAWGTAPAGKSDTQYDIEPKEE